MTGNFKAGDRVVVRNSGDRKTLGDTHGSFSGVVLGVGRWNFVRLNGCECTRKHREGYDYCVGLGDMLLDPDTTPDKSSEEYQEKAQTLKDWFGGNE